MFTIKQRDEVGNTNAVNVLWTSWARRRRCRALWAVAVCGYRGGKYPEGPNGSEWHCSTHSKCRNLRTALEIFLTKEVVAMLGLKFSTLEDGGL